jgi:MFS family permease
MLNRNFFLLWQGQLVSLVGTQLFRLVLVIWLTQVAQSATLLGLLMATFVVPGLVAGPLGGVLIDRYSRRLVLVTCDVIQGFAVLSLGILWLLVPATHPASIVGIFALAFIVGATTAVFQPAAISIVPEIVPGAGLPKANSLIQGSFQAGALAAQSLSGLSFRLIGAPVLAFIDAGTYFYSALSAFLIKTPPAPQRPAAAVARPSFRREFGAAMRYVRATTGLLLLVVLSGAIKFFVAPFAVLLPFYVQGQLGATPDWYGYLVGGMGVGALIGFTLSGTLKLGPTRGGKLIVIAIVAQALALTALAVVSSVYAALALITCSGVLNGFVSVRLTTLLQMSVAAEMRGRVFGVVRTVTDGLVPLATVLAGVIADLTGRNIPLVYAGCGLALTATALMVAASASCRAFLSGAAIVRPPAVRPELRPETAVAAGVER